MALLTSARNTPCKGNPTFLAYPMEAAITMYLGGLACIDDNGYLNVAQPLTGTTPFTKTPLIVGVSNNVVGGDFGENAVNLTTGSMIPNPPNLGSAGALIMNTWRGVALLDINGSSIAQAQVGQMAFAVDDHTVDVADGTITTVATSTAITVASGTPPYTLPHENIVKGSFSASSATGGTGTVYVEGTDYDVDYQAGILTFIAGGGISAGTIYIGYKWAGQGRPVVGRIVGLELNMVWVDLTQQSNYAA